MANTRSSKKCPALPKSISSTNLERTTRVQSVVQQDLVRYAPHGGTNYFSTVPAFTLTLPSLDKHPGDFQQCVFSQLIDKSTQKFLEGEKCLNWCAANTRFLPLKTQGDANCLLHAASLGMWGLHDRDYTLRRAVFTALQNHTTSQLYRRWKHTREQENSQMGIQLEDFQWEREWQATVNQASTDVPQGKPSESLKDFHIFVLANVLRRPIVMHAFAPKLWSQAIGGTLKQVNFRGIYLPLLWDPHSCKKDPLPLAYYGGHFVALVAVENTQQYNQGGFTLPLVDFHGQTLPVRFTLSMEDPTAMIGDYLRVVSVSGHNSPYITSTTVVCAKLSISKRPEYLEPLLSGFVKSCNSAYYGKQPGQPQPYPSFDQMPPITRPMHDNTSAPPTPQGREKCINHCGKYGDPDKGGLCFWCHQKYVLIEQDFLQDNQLSPPHSQSTLKLEDRLEKIEIHAKNLATRLENTEAHSQKLVTKLERTEIHAQDLAARLENTETHAQDLAAKLENTGAHAQNLAETTATHAQDLAAKLKNTEIKVQDLATRLENTETHAQDLATRLENTETHAQGLATRLENTEAHAQDLAARLENTETHARNLTTVLSTLEIHARELRTLLAGHASPDAQPWVVSPTEVHMTEEEIGRGGWGSVQVAEFRGQRVAAKTLHDQIISPNNLHLFTREMNMSARAHHPHIVQFIGATIEGVPIILLELMSTSLRRQLAAAPLPTAQALSIATHISRALNYLHLMQPRPLIHRDVSSANVLLEPAPPPALWKAKLSDFGATNFVSVMATAGPGNPLYAAPEAFNPYQQTPKMDVFSFGVVLIESFTRQMPSVEARDDLIGRIRWRAVVPLVCRCIEREQERRPAMEAVLTELSQLQRTV